MMPYLIIYTTMIGALMFFSHKLINIVGGLLGLHLDVKRWQMVIIVMGILLILGLVEEFKFKKDNPHLK